MSKNRLWFLLILHGFFENPISFIKYQSKHAWLLCKRYLYPPGMMLVFLGPDGVGKTTIIKELKKTTLFAKKQQFYLLPGFLPRYRRANSEPKVINTDPHGRKTRSKLFSVAKQTVWLTEYILGYFFIVKKALFHNKLVLFDRYYYDMLVDTKRYRYDGPQWVLSLCAKLVPKPDLLIVLQAPAHVIYSRKQEVSYEELERQLQIYASINYCEHVLHVETAMDIEKIYLTVSRSVLGALTDKKSIKNRA